MDYDLLLKEQIVSHQTSYICTNYIPSAKIHKSIVKPREDSDKVKRLIRRKKMKKTMTKEEMLQNFTRWELNKVTL